MFFTIAFILACLPWTSTYQSEKIVLDGRKYTLIEDMLFDEDTPQEKGMFDVRKFWVNNSVPTVLYAVHPDRSMYEKIFDDALGVLESMTCIKFVKVAPDDPRHKILYKNASVGLCASPVGNTSAINQTIVIGGGCENSPVITHETMHALGFSHTQARTDRDDYIKVLPQNAQLYPDKFNLITNGSMYDFSSLMHYLNYFFANGHGPTFVTRDPSHERYIFTSQVIGFSESYQLAQFYDCFDIMGLNCPNRTCLNGGFILNNCSCFCPRNFTGPQCETFAGPWFKPDVNDRKVDQPGVILTRKYPFENLKMEALTWVRLPKCFYPRMLVMTNDLLDDYWDDHLVRMEDFRYTFKNILNNKTGTIRNGSGPDFILKQENRHSAAKRGVQLAIDFIPDGNCTNFYTEFFKIVCFKQTFPDGSWIYESPNYPNPTSNGMACKAMTPTDENNLGTYHVEFTYKLEKGERLDVTYGMNVKETLVGPVNNSLVFSAYAGSSFVYKASKTGNTGFFRYKATPFRVPKICNKVTNVTGSLKVTQPFNWRYPQCSYPNGGMCNLFFQSQEGKALKITFNEIQLKSTESFVVYQDYPDMTKNFVVVSGPHEPIIISGSKMLVTYKFKKQEEFSPYEITVSEV